MRRLSLSKESRVRVIQFGPFVTTPSVVLFHEHQVHAAIVTLVGGTILLIGFVFLIEVFSNKKDPDA